MATTTLRPLSLSEKGLIGFARQHGNWRVCIAADVASTLGFVTEPEVRDALVSLRDRHAVLGLRVMGTDTGGKKAFQSASVEFDTSVDMTAKLTCLPDSVENWEEAWRTEFQQPLAWGDGPVRVVVAPKKSRGNDGEFVTCVVLMCEHAFCDASSLSNLLHEILLRVGGESEKFEEVASEQLEFTASIESMARKQTGVVSIVTGLIGIFLRLACSLTFVLIREGGAAALMRMFRKHDARTHGEVNPSDQHHSDVEFSSDETDALLLACRSHNATITGALGAAVQDALRAQFSDDDTKRPSGLFCAANGRQFYSPPLPQEVLGFHATTVSPWVTAMSGKKNSTELWEKARTFCDRLVSSINRGEPLTLAVVLGIRYTQLAKTLPFENLPDGNAVFLTNWGTLDVKPQYRHLRVLDLHPGITTSQFHLPLVIAWSWNDRLKVSVHHGGSDISVGGVQALSEAIRERLVLLARTSRPKLSRD